MRVQVGEVASDLWQFSAIALAIGFAVLLVVFWWCKRSLSYLLCLTVFSFYLLLALDKIFFPLQVSGYYVDFMRQQPFLYFVNLIPFYFGPYGTLESAFSTLMLNVLLTMPFGFGINFLARIRAKAFLWIAPAVGLSIEGMQLFISLLGYAYRIIDINDVLMNALGVWIGYGLFRLFARLYVWAIGRLGIKPWGLAAYVYEVASGAI